MMIGSHSSSNPNTERHLVNSRCLSFCQYPIQDVAPSAVRIADAIEMIICTINLVVSFLVIIAEI